ncbi:MAG: hypothetical protein BRC58_10245 [Cyanobacteria bacterium QS_8_64_29]|nr:MAG: hypothetical protein BRC58_10245 [Cyanobacteria bacterium QS_8_64_29]
MCQRYRIARLQVFGSAAERQADADARDIDLLAEFADVPNIGPVESEQNSLVQHSVGTKGRRFAPLRLALLAPAY